ncbi:MAG: hypothetical protein AABW58_01055 [Nanoarchaeota archaeon]
MVETETEKNEIVKENLKITFYHLAPRPIAFAEMMRRNLEARFGEAREVRTGNIQQLEYKCGNTFITLEVLDTGITNIGMEGKVKVHLYSGDRKSIEAVIAQKGWTLLDLKRTDLEVSKAY